MVVGLLQQRLDDAWRDAGGHSARPLVAVRRRFNGTCFRECAETSHGRLKRILDHIVVHQANVGAGIVEVVERSRPEAFDEINHTNAEVGQRVRRIDRQRRMEVFARLVQVSLSAVSVPQIVVYLFVALSLVVKASDL